MNAKRLMLTVLIVLSMLVVLPADDLDETEAVTVDEEAPATFSLTASYVNADATDVRLVINVAGEEAEPQVFEMTQDGDKWTSSLELPLPMEGTYYFEVSTDGGETWTSTGEMCLGGKIAIDPFFCGPDPFEEYWHLMNEMMRPRPMRPRMYPPRRPVLVWL